MRCNDLTNCAYYPKRFASISPRVDTSSTFSVTSFPGQRSRWSHLIGFKQYPEWNPFIKSISGELTIASHPSTTLRWGAAEFTLRLSKP